MFFRNKSFVNTKGEAIELHVVVEARVDKDSDDWWVLDADYGVVIEHDLNEIAQNPELVRSAYQEKGYLDLVIDDLVLYYSTR